MASRSRDFYSEKENYQVSIDRIKKWDVIESKVAAAVKCPK